MPSKQCVVGSNPTRAALFYVRRKKELFGLVALPFFLFMGLRVFMYIDQQRSPNLKVVLKHLGDHTH